MHQRADEQFHFTDRQTRSTAAALTTQLARWGVRVQLYGIRDEASTTALYRGVRSKRGEDFLQKDKPAEMDDLDLQPHSQPGWWAAAVRRQLDQSHQRHQRSMAGGSEANRGGGGMEGMRHEGMRHGGLEGSWSRGARLLEARASSLEENSSACTGWEGADADH